MNKWRSATRRLLVGADHNILWFGEELAGEEVSESRT